MFTRPKDKTILSFSGSPTVALARLLLESTPGVQCSETLLRSSPTLQTLQTLPPPTICLCSLRSAGLVKRVWPAPDQWLLAGPDSLPLWLCRVCAFVLLRCFSCPHTVLPKEHSLGVIFFSSLSSCKFCIFLQFYLHFTTDYTCMIVYVTNNKEPRGRISRADRGRWVLLRGMSTASRLPVQCRQGRRRWRRKNLRILWRNDRLYSQMPRPFRRDLAGIVAIGSCSSAADPLVRFSTTARTNSRAVSLRD